LEVIIKPQNKIQDTFENIFLDSLLSKNTIAINAGTNTDWGIPPSEQLSESVIRLGGGIPDPLLIPQDDLRDGFRHIQSFSDDTFFRYGGPVGYELLRKSIAEHYSSSIMQYDDEQFILTNGSAGAIELVFKTIIDPGDIVIVEAPTFSGSLRTFRGYQANIISVPTDENGMDTDALEAILSKQDFSAKKVKIVYTISNFHNPTGSYLNDDRRKHLIQLAKRYNFIIIDDDAYGEINFTDLPSRPLRDFDDFGHVITVGTFSKTIATGMRVGWICAHPLIAKKILTNRFDMGNSPILHGLIAHFMQSGNYQKHVQKIKKIYAQKMNWLLNSIEKTSKDNLDFFVPAGGFFLWLGLKQQSASELQKIALGKKLVFPHGSVFFSGDEYQDSFIRLAFSKSSEDELKKSGQILSASLQEL
jgi:2-aminoadipate transaminase